MDSTFRVKLFFLGTNSETLRQTGAKRRRIPKIIDFPIKIHRCLIKISPNKLPESSLSEFFRVPSHHLWRTWGPQHGPEFPSQRSLLFLLNLRQAPRSCTFCTFLGVRRCHAEASSISATVPSGTHGVFNPMSNLQIFKSCNPLKKKGVEDPLL